MYSRRRPTSTPTLTPGRIRAQERDLSDAGVKGAEVLLRKPRADIF
jgi:hypothetical protein